MKKNKSLSLDTCTRDLGIKTFGSSFMLQDGLRDPESFSDFSKKSSLQFPNRDVKIYPISNS